MIRALWRRLMSALSPAPVDWSGNPEDYGVDGELITLAATPSRILEISQQIAEEIGAQTELDNLGDCESVVFMEDFPVLNLIQFTEGLIKRGIVKP